MLLHRDIDNCRDGKNGFTRQQGHRGEQTPL